MLVMISKRFESLLVCVWLAPRPGIPLDSTRGSELHSGVLSLGVVYSRVVSMRAAGSSVPGCPRLTDSDHL